MAAIFLSATGLFLTAMLVGAVLGGYAGAHVARKVPPRLLRATILTIAVTMTALYFLRG